MNKITNSLQDGMLISIIDWVVLIAAIFWLIFVVAAVIRLVAKQRQKKHWTNDIEQRNKEKCVGNAFKTKYQ